jgi:hypothetical protein
MADGAKEWARKDPKGETIDDKLKSVCDSTEDGCFLEKLTDSDPDSEQYEWLIERLVPKGEPMIIAGKGASGKSSLALEFSAQIMEKDPDVGVVYICAEGTYRDTKVKARKMGLTKSNFYFLKRTGGGTSFKLSEKKDLNLVTSALTKAHNAGDKIVFVVIDSIRGMAKGSLNDDAIGEVMHSVNAELSGRLGITVCYIHHGKKNDKDMASMDAFLGSVTIVNAIRYGLFVRKKTSGLRTVEVAKSNLGNDDIFFKSEMDAIGRIQLTYEGVVGAESEANPTQLDKAEEIILSYLGQGEDERAYIIYKRGEAQGISDRTMKTAKKALGVESYQKKKTWYWRMPSHILKKHEVAQSAPKQSDLNRHEAAPYVPKQSNLNM